VLEAQRERLGDAVVDLALAPLRERLNALDATHGRDEALRMVSVVFLDVVESTAMSRGLDPEDVRALFHTALRSFSSAVERYEGRVLRYAGDGMLALFGASAVREDDAERAVLCGLALIEEARALAPRFRSEHGVADFDVRVGISTGPVLLSRGIDNGYDVSGMSVNVAARMEQTAPAGKLRISHHTFVHVRGLFDVVEQPPIAVKGLDQPILTFVVERARRRTVKPATDEVEAFAHRLVGRDRELGRLTDAFGQVSSNHRMQVLMLSGEAGMGKSRLLGAFSDWLEQRPASNERFYARSDTYSKSVPYGLVRDFFFSRFGIADSDTLPAAGEEARGRIDRLLRKSRRRTNRPCRSAGGPRFQRQSAHHRNSR
jgi:class 3 adenylate cyclase